MRNECALLCLVLMTEMDLFRLASFDCDTDYTTPDTRAHVSYFQLRKQHCVCQFYAIMHEMKCFNYALQKTFDRGQCAFTTIAGAVINKHY